MWLAKALITRRVCAGWSEALLVAQTISLKISCRGSFCVSKTWKNMSHKLGWISANNSYCQTHCLCVFRQAFVFSIHVIHFILNYYLIINSKLVWLPYNRSLLLLCLQFTHIAFHNCGLCFNHQSTRNKIPLNWQQNSLELELSSKQAMVNMYPKTMSMPFLQA